MLKLKDISILFIRANVIRGDILNLKNGDLLKRGHMFK